MNRAFLLDSYPILNPIIRRSKILAEAYDFQLQIIPVGVSQIGALDVGHESVAFQFLLVECQVKIDGVFERTNAINVFETALFQAFQRPRKMLGGGDYQR